MPTPQTTENLRETVKALNDRLSQCAALVRNGDKLTSVSDFANIKRQATEVVNQVESMGDEASDDDQRAADQALLIAQAAEGWMRSMPTGRRTSPNPLPRGTFGNPGADIDLAGGRAISLADLLKADAGGLDDGGFESFGQFLRAVRDQQMGVRNDERLQKFAGQVGGSGPYGGFLVPDMFMARMIATEVAAEPWLGLLNSIIIPDGRGDVVTPVLADRDRSGADVGGAELGRVSESGEIPLSTMVFQSRKAILNKAGTRVRVSNELLTDNAVGLEAVIQQTFARAVSLRRALDFYSGVGVGEPTGILNSAATYEQAAEGQQVADTIVSENILNMWSRLAPAVRSRAVWLAHPGTFPKIAAITISAGLVDRAVFLADVTRTEPNSIFGRPLFFTEAAPLLGEKADIAVFDPQSYQYVMKPLRIEMSRDYRWANDETEFKIVLRDDGAPLYTSTRTDAQGYENSEFVVLAERA